MERVARRLAVFSLGAMAAVIAFGFLRGLDPVKAFFSGVEPQRHVALFHSHFDQLCWLGTAALAATMWILRDYYVGAMWPPMVVLWTYPMGALLFSTAFLTKAAGLSLDNAALAGTASAGLVSLGGLLLVGSLVAAIFIAWGVRPTSRKEREQF